MKGYSTMQSIAFLSLAMLAAMASAQTQGGAPKTPKSLLFLTPAQLDPSRLLAPPPKDGSDIQMKEMAAVKHLIQTRPADRYAQAKWDAAHEDITPFVATIGAGFDLEKLPATAKLLAGVLNDQGIA